MARRASSAALLLVCTAVAGCGEHNAYTDAATIAEPAVAEVILRDQAAKTKAEAVTAQRPILPFFGGEDRSQQPTAKETAATALARIGPDAVPALIVALDDPDAETREGAAHALALMGPKAAEAVPALIRHLSDSDENVRVVSARALGQIGPMAKDAIPNLIGLLKGKPEPAAHEAAPKLPAAPQSSITPQSSPTPAPTRSSTGHTRRIYESPLPSPSTGPSTP